MIKTASLTPNLFDIIYNKSTELPNTGCYNTSDQSGTYLCRNCGLALFRAKHKFHSGCGWPSFDNEIPSKVKRISDKDGRRTEIVCSQCSAHLGHVFVGESFTANNLRHCVNSASLDFVTDENVLNTEEAIFAAGCFWGVEYYFKKLAGVLKTEVGYSGGVIDNPTYKDVCDGESHHFEVIRVIYDPLRISYLQVVKYFFEIHDFSQIDGQGPDIGEQYLSKIFYYDDIQKTIANTVIKELQNKGYSVATTIQPVTTFWMAEDYHQDYYTVNHKEPYCHTWIKKF